MKKKLKAIITFATISMLMLSSTILANAEVVTEGSSNIFFTRNQESGEDIIAQLTFSKTPIEGKKIINRELPIDHVDGYEWKCVYLYYDIPDTDYKWDLQIENAKDWGGVDYNEEEKYHFESFTITDNNIDYTQCKYFSVDYAGGAYVYVRVPSGYKGNMLYCVYPVKLVDGKRVADNTVELIFPFNDDNSQVTATVAGTPAWKQDAIGWRVENSDGSYLINSWYQSPDSGLWYYLGEDGYMLTNRNTPDGYFINADGVWIQE